MAKKTQYYGIKYPFTVNNEDGLFVDLNNDLRDKVGSEIAHVLLTPKGSRIMMPEFGTDLIKFIFNENNEENWDDVEDEIKEAVAKYVPNASINEINAVRDENDDNAVYIDVQYSVKRGLSTENNRMVIKL